MNVFTPGFNAAVGNGGAAAPHLSVHDDPRAIETLWRDFEDRAVGHVFQNFDWIASWLDHVGAANTIAPRIVVVRYGDGRPAALLPLGIRTTRGIRRLEWLGSQLADYHCGLFDPPYLAQLNDTSSFSAFFAALVNGVGAFDVAHFTRQPESLGGYPNPFRSLPSFPTASSAHAADLGTDWTCYYQHRRPKGWRRTDRRKSERLAAVGDLAFVIAEDEETRDAILTALFEQKRQGLAQIGVGDMFAPPGVRGFYRALARRPWPQGPAHLCALYCGERIAATNFGVIRGDTYYYVLHAYDLGEFAEYSPGRQLMYELMQWCIAQGIPRLDFTVGDEAYKGHWCDETLGLFDSVVPITWRGRAAAASRRLTETTKRAIKTNPRLWAAAQTMRKGIRSIRR